MVSQKLPVGRLIHADDNMLINPANIVFAEDAGFTEPVDERGGRAQRYLRYKQCVSASIGGGHGCSFRGELGIPTMRGAGRESIPPGEVRPDAVAIAVASRDARP